MIPGIIQDSKKDWRYESTKMASIYRHSILNIAATGFPDGTKGLFPNRDPILLTPIQVVIEDDLEAYWGPREISSEELPLKEFPADRVKHLDDHGPGNYFLFEVNSWEVGVNESPLCQRGWVVQERALSIRTLHFGREQLFWECLCHRGSEVFPRGNSSAVTGALCKLGPKVDHQKRRVEKMLDVRDKIKRSIQERKELLEKIIAQERREAELEAEWAAEEEEWKAEEAKWKEGNDDENDDDEEEEDEANDESEISVLAKSAKSSLRELLEQKTKLEDCFLDFRFSPRDFEGCDINILNGLEIEGWEEFRAKLMRWGLGKEGQDFEPRPSRGESPGLGQWLQMVMAYSKGRLSYSKDKLVAISGIARFLKDSVKAPYLAGLWRRDMEHQLLWKVEKALPAISKDGTRGPSWSWASVDGAVAISTWSGYYYVK